MRLAFAIVERPAVDAGWEGEYRGLRECGQGNSFYPHHKSFTGKLLQKLSTFPHQAVIGYPRGNIVTPLLDKVLRCWLWVWCVEKPVG